MIKYECNQCGKCCQGADWLKNIVKPEDIDRWQKLERNDILKYICSCCSRVVNPEKKQPWNEKNCPFLDFHEGKASCQIYDVRPKACVKFPLNECENPECDNKFHFHSWLWNGKCQASKKFRDKLVEAVEHDIEA